MQVATLPALILSWKWATEGDGPANPVAAQTSCRVCAGEVWGGDAHAVVKGRLEGWEVFTG